MKKLLLPLFLAFSSCAHMAPAEMVEGECKHMDIVHKELGEVWQEVPIMSGMWARDDSVVVMWVNAQNGSWTLLNYRGNNACVMAMGWGAVSVITPKGDPT